MLGYGKTHKDAASVRATHPIPSACGLYYFEVKIVSKGRDGYVLDVFVVKIFLIFISFWFCVGIWELVCQLKELT